MLLFREATSIAAAPSGIDGMERNSSYRFYFSSLSFHSGQLLVISCMNA